MKTIRITKYPNRRLYSKETAEYITRDHLALLLRESNSRVIVIERTTERDITAEVLLQIIQSRPHPSLNVDTLLEIVRAGADMRVVVVEVGK